MAINSDKLLSSLRKKLRQKDETQNWLNGITVTATPEKINVGFCNPLFAKWFMASKEAIFRELVRSVAGTDSEIEYAFPETCKPVVTPKAPVVTSPCLDDYMDSGKNSLALAAAKTACASLNEVSGVAQLVFCGEPGVGKTHILQGMRLLLEQNFGTTMPVLARASQFLEPGWQMRNLHTGAFWRQHRALLLDDLDELLENGEKQLALSAALSQAELAASENQALSIGLFFAFNGDAANLARLRESLYARLRKSMVFQLVQPDLTTRLAFIDKAAREAGLPLKREQILFLARQGKHIPVLEGILKKLVFFKSHSGRLPTEAELEGLLEGQTPQKQPGWRAILEKVCQKLAVSPEKALENTRKPDIALARQIAMYLCRKRLGLSYPELGRLFGGKDHSTVIHSIQKIEGLKDTDKITRNLLTELENSLT